MSKQEALEYINTLERLIAEYENTAKDMRTEDDRQFFLGRVRGLKDSIFHLKKCWNLE